MAGSTLCTVDVAGKFGRDLAAKGAKDMVAFALDWLDNLYGAGLKRAAGRSHATNWNQEPWVLGAMSAASPGGQFARRSLMKSINNRIWFAGEAVHERLWGTVGGAWESGDRAALAALRVIAPPHRNRSSRNRSNPGVEVKSMPVRALIAWSSGKDSAWALHEARRSGRYELVGALTTVTETFSRVSMHGVREELLAAQLDAAGLAPIRVPIPYPCSNEVYEARMATALADAKAKGVTHMIFGDLFLEDVRRYREEKLAGTGIAPVFPLWQRPTDALAREMIDGGVETYLACVDLKQLPIAFAGRRLDHALLASCRRAPIPAARRASSTPSWRRDRC